MINQSCISSGQTTPLQKELQCPRMLHFRLKPSESSSYLIKTLYTEFNSVALFSQYIHFIPQGFGLSQDLCGLIHRVNSVAVHSPLLSRYCCIVLCPFLDILLGNIGYCVMISLQLLHAPLHRISISSFSTSILPLAQIYFPE